MSATGNCWRKEGTYMPVVDMSLEKLKVYQGINPCPTDMDAYWNESLAEMRALKDEVSLTPAKFQAPNAECFDMWFTGTGGARVYAKYVRPKTAGKHPAVLQFHGYSGDSGDWWDKLAWVNAGFCVASLDCRGQGGLSEDVGGVEGTTLRGHIIRGLSDPDPKKLLYRSIFLDTAQMAKIVMSFAEVDADRVGAMGGSQGGGLTLACASLVPEIKLAAPVYPFLSDYRRVWEMDLCKGAYEELGYYFRRFDPCHERQDDVFTRLGYIDVQHLTKRIKAEVMMGTGLMDTTCPPSTQFAAYNKITSKKKVVIYHDFGHEGLPHFTDMTFQFMCGLL